MCRARMIIRKCVHMSRNAVLTTQKHILQEMSIYIYNYNGTISSTTSKLALIKMELHSHLLMQSTYIYFRIKV